MALDKLDLAQILAACPVPMFIAKNDGEIIYKNQMLEEIIPGDTPLVKDLVAPESAPGTRLIARSEPMPAKPIKLSVALKSGKSAIISFRAVKDSEYLVGEVRPSDDEAVSEAEKLEGVIQMARALGHELNQPLTVIMGQAEIMTLRLRENDDAVNRLNTIISEVERMMGLTGKLSKIVRYKTQTYADGTPYLDINEASE